MDWFTQAIQDVGNALEDGVEAVGDALEDGVEAVVDFVGDTAEVVINTVEAAVSSTVGFVRTAVDVATGERDVSAFGDWAGNTMDDLVFDQVDYITGGAVDLDYDDGQFSAGLDFGIGSAGVSFGEQGFSADAGFDIGVAEVDMSYNSAQGFAATGSLGLDWGGLPTLEGHVSISPDGDVGGGLLVESIFSRMGVEGEMMQNPDGSWSASGSINGRIDAPLVGTAQFNAEGSVSVAADGDFEAAGELDGYVRNPLGSALGTAGGQVSSEDGQFDASAHAEGHGHALGMEASGGRAVTVSAGGGHLEVDMDNWSDSTFPNQLDPSVLVTDTGLGRPPSIEDAFGAAAGGLGMSGGAAAAQFAESSADPVTGINAAPKGGGSDNSVPGRSEDSSAGPGTGINAAPKGGGSDNSVPGRSEDSSADPGTPEQWPDLGVGSSVETGAWSEEPMVEVPNPGPPEDFSADLAAADQAGEAADDIWDGMGTSEG